MVRQLFERAREEKPAIVFVDEVDSLVIFVCYVDIYFDFCN